MSRIMLVGFLAATASAFPPAQAPRSVGLDGEWRMQRAIAVTNAPAAERWNKFTVPGKAPGQLRAMWIERDIETPAGWAGSQWVLRSEMLEQPATVFVDGIEAGVFNPPGDALDLTATIKPGTRQVLRMYMKQDMDEDLPGILDAAGSSHLGIAGSLRLDAVAAKLAVVDAFLMPSVRQKTLNAKVDFYAAEAMTDVTLRAKVVGQDGKTAREFSTTLPALPAGESTQTVSFPWDNPVLWELDRPYLYTIELTAAGRTTNVCESATIVEYTSVNARRQESVKASEVHRTWWW